MKKHWRKIKLELHNFFQHCSAEAIDQYLTLSQDIPVQIGHALTSASWQAFMISPASSSSFFSCSVNADKDLSLSSSPLCKRVTPSSHFFRLLHRRDSSGQREFKRTMVCDYQCREAVGAHRSAVLMATFALVMVEEHSSRALLMLSSLSCWAFSLWLLISTIRLWSLFTSFSTFPALLDAASKSGKQNSHIYLENRITINGHGKLGPDRYAYNNNATNYRHNIQWFYNTQCYSISLTVEQRQSCFLFFWGGVVELKKNKIKIANMGWLNRPGPQANIYHIPIWRPAKKLCDKWTSI